MRQTKLYSLGCRKGLTILNQTAPFFHVYGRISFIASADNLHSMGSGFFPSSKATMVLFGFTNAAFLRHKLLGLCLSYLSTLAVTLARMI